jgi:hypothetical protein
VVGVTSATLAGELVSGVLGSVASDGVEVTVVTTEGDVEADDRLAGLDVLEVLRVNAGLGGGRVEEELHLLEETRLIVLVMAGSSGRRDLGGESALEGGLEGADRLEVLDALHIEFLLVSIR